jgi:hypothetical protein
MDCFEKKTLEKCLFFPTNPIVYTTDKKTIEHQKHTHTQTKNLINHKQVVSKLKIKLFQKLLKSVELLNFSKINPIETKNKKTTNKKSSKNLYLPKIAL